MTRAFGWYIDKYVVLRPQCHLYKTTNLAQCIGTNWYVGHEIDIKTTEIKVQLKADVRRFSLKYSFFGKGLSVQYHQNGML